jgi:diacylglycerol kinase family enzyme
LAGFLIVNPRSGDGRPTAEELAAEARSRTRVRYGRLLAAVDGEPSEHDSPVELRIDARALRVLMPPEA